MKRPGVLMERCNVVFHSNVVRTERPECGAGKCGSSPRQTFRARHSAQPKKRGQERQPRLDRFRPAPK
ncbi:hypothetical protein HPB47_022332 [Ixodes persulcatus]|uniref:Uncharacterized protein n=1 Tax=Ixodes persulcatus TaxID=34615 RepID=A0AC60QAD4_IXOPE|nr:hypothetical protein HPB47_022332 [Ixodes persulcatus]